MITLPRAKPHAPGDRLLDSSIYRHRLFANRLNLLGNVDPRGRVPTMILRALMVTNVREVGHSTWIGPLPNDPTL